jgi:hypothetical protein
MKVNLAYRGTTVDDVQAPVNAPNGRRWRTRSIVLVAVIVLALAGGITLLVGIGSGGSSPKGAAASPVSRGTGTVPTGDTDVFLAGNATPTTYPAGDPGEIAVVYLGPVTEMAGGGATVPVVIRNNTPGTVAHIAITGIAEESDGTHIATGTSQEQVEPAQLTPGTIGYTFIHFSATTEVPPPDSVYEITVKSSPADTSTLNTASIKVTASAGSATSITGTGTNTTGRELRGPYAVEAFCFDPQGKLSAVASAATSQLGVIPVGGSVNFAVPLNGASCSSYLVGISGNYA